MLTAFFWILIISCLIKAITHIVRGIPGFAEESRLKYEEEKWRKQKELDYLKSIEFARYTDIQMYNMMKRNNPYRKDLYYLFKPKDREFFNPKDPLFY